MSTFANLPATDVEVTFASGAIKTVNVLVLLVETQNAEFKASTGEFLPGVGKLRPTIAAMVEKYELDYFYDGPVRTWSECAEVLRHVYGLVSEHASASR